MRQLEPREKKILIFGGVAAVAILLYAFVLAPLNDSLAQKRRLLPAKEKQLVEMRRWQQEYGEMRKRLQEAQAAAEKRGPLLTEIETLTRRANLAGKIVSLKPQAGAQAGGVTESLVEVRLDNVTLYDVVHYVFLIEGASLRVKKLAFKQRFDNPKLLNLTILIASTG